jgi:hypothetical protein
VSGPLTPRLGRSDASKANNVSRLGRGPRKRPRKVTRYAGIEPAMVRCDGRDICRLEPHGCVVLTSHDGSQWSPVPGSGWGWETCEMEGVR